MLERTIITLFQSGTLATAWIFAHALVGAIDPDMTGLLQFLLPLALVAITMVPWAVASRRTRHPQPTGEHHVR